MKRLRILIVGLSFTLVLAGCLSLSDTPTPRFYMLRTLDQIQAEQTFSIPSDVIIAIGPVKVPEYQSRPQIVTQDKERMLSFAQFDRWGENIERGLARVMLENLALMLPGVTLEMFPYNYAIPVKYQVFVDVVKLESQLDKDMFLAAQWSIINLDNKKMLFTKRSEFTQAVNPQNYSGLTEALSNACASLSSEIAQELARLANQPTVPIVSLPE